MQVEYLTAEQAAERLSVNEQTIRRYIRSGELRAAKVGRKYIITSDDLLNFVRAQADKQPPPKLHP